MAVLRGLGKVVFWLAARFLPITILLLTVAPVQFFAGLITAMRGWLGMPGDPNLLQHAEQITLIAVSAAVVVVDAVWFFVTKALQGNYFRLKIELTLTPAGVFISRRAAPPQPVPVTLVVNIHPPRTRLGAGLVTWAILNRSIIYLSWKRSAPGSFRLGGDERCVKCAPSPDVSHLRIPLVNLRSVDANSPCADQFIIQVAPDGPTPNVTDRWTKFHLKVGRSFAPTGGPAGTPAITQHSPIRRAVLRILLKLSVTGSARKLFRVRVHE
jgi:hypothetical protein